MAEQGMELVIFCPSGSDPQPELQDDVLLLSKCVLLRQMLLSLIPV